MAGWVTELTPRHFGFLRSRWCCGVLVLLLLEIHHLQVSPETVRRWLHREQLVWRRPRPVVGPTDPQRAAKLQALRQLLATLPANEIAVFQDEVDINTNPKIGAMWMRRGQQAELRTPGTNEKRYLAGSLNWRTGALIVTEGFPKQGIGIKLSSNGCRKCNGCVLLAQALAQYWCCCSSFSCCLGNQPFCGGTGLVEKAAECELGLKEPLQPPSGQSLARADEFEHTQVPFFLQPQGRPPRGAARIIEQNEQPAVLGACRDNPDRGRYVI